MRWGPAAAIGIIGAIFLALATQASAAWLHKGQGELKENASITMSGEVTLTTSAGNISCPTSIGATLTKESTAGDVNSYTVSEPSKCDVTGSLGSICGTHGLTKVEKTGTWELTATESDIAVSSIDLHFTFAGCLISGFRLKGSSTLSVTKASAISSASLSGSQDLYNALGEKAGTGSLGGTLSVSPAATYGIQPVPEVETKWRMDDEPLSEDEELGLSGTFSFSYSGGAVSCPATATLGLTAGTVEEETPEGEVKSFTVSEPSKCDVTGALKTLCGTNSVASVEKTGSWDLTTNEEDISIAGLKLDYKFEKCAVTSLRIEGSATLSVDKPATIAEATFSGGPSVYNASEEKLGTGELSGSQAASPAGTFGIHKDEEETEHEHETHEKETHEEETKTHEEMTDEGEAEEPAEHMFFHEEEPIGAGKKTVKFLGTVGFSFESGGFQCGANMKIQTGTNVASLKEFSLETNTCEGTGVFSHCELAEDALTEGAELTPTGIDAIKITGFKHFYKFSTSPGEGSTSCAVAGLPLEFTFSSIELEAETNGLGRITGLQVTGSTGGVMEIVPSTPIAAITTSGSFTVVGEPTISTS